MEPPASGPKKHISWAFFMSLDLIQKAERVIVPLQKKIRQKFPEPVLLVVMGVPGSGKSFVARKIAAKFPFYYAAADNVRLALCPDPDFCETENHQTYHTLYAVTRKLLDAGESVVIDGTIPLREYRREIRELFGSCAHLVLLFIDPPRETVQARLQNRQADFQDPLKITFAGSTDLLERFEKQLERPLPEEAKHFFHIRNKNVSSLTKELRPIHQLLRSYLTP